MKILLCYFWIFILGNFLGFIIETVWCFIKNGRLESRKGLIYEPFIPIYGVTGVLIVLVIHLLKISQIYEIFMVGVLISTIIEYISSFLQEKIFATKSWDYTKFPINLNGRVNLIYSILFGLVTTMAYKLFLLPFITFFAKIKVKLFLIVISVGELIFLLYDIIISFIAVYRMKERRNNITRNNKFWTYIDNKYNDNYLKKVYSNMVPIK
ncbi:MAG: putative ABC transporter permease [Bacilli bacterium]|nr:putative ABC transporter permease [Bacilli bacterium]